MNTRVIGIIIGIIVIAAVIYFAMGNNPDSAQNQDKEMNQDQVGSTNSQEEVADSGPSSLKDLLAGGSQTCTYTDGTVTGTVYASNGKARIDSSSDINGATQAAHIIVEQNMYYMWMDGETQGIKMAIDPSTQASVQQGMTAQQNLDLNRQADYECSSGVSDSSKFDLPSGVTFTDYSSLQMQIPNMNPGM